MPISQDRMLALINIIDEAQRARELLCQHAQAELDEATSDFYREISSDPKQLASNLFGRIQSLASAILDNPRGISTTSLETLVREREHFRNTGSRNARAARAMARKRNKTRHQQNTEQQDTFDASI